MSMLEPEFKSSFETWQKDPTPNNNAAILKTIEPSINGAIKTHVGASNPLLFSRARRMSLDALRSYDPTRGRLQTHIYNHLQGLKRVAREHTQVLKVPERMQLDHYQLSAAVDGLTNELGREPSDAELMDHTGFSGKRLRHLRTYNPAISESAMQDQTTGADFSGAVDPAKAGKSAWVQLIYDDMDPYHQKIMEHSLGLNGHPVLPNHVLARKLRRSPGAISQAKLRIQKALDEEQDYSPFIPND